MPTPEQMEAAREEDDRQMKEAQRETQRLLAERYGRPGQTKKSPMQCRQGNEPIVTVKVPKKFTLTLNDHSFCEVQAGVQPVPKSIADHFYAKCNGVEAYDGTQMPTSTNEVEAIREQIRREERIKAQREAQEAVDAERQRAEEARAQDAEREKEREKLREEERERIREEEREKLRAEFEAERKPNDAGGAGSPPNTGDDSTSKEKDAPAPRKRKPLADEGD